MKLTTILIAIGAALTSALLFAGLATQSAFAVGFALATPVPVVIASLGWGSSVGFLAALLAPALLFVLTGNAPSTITLALAMTVPAAICSSLALRRFDGSDPAAATAASSQWMPVSRVLFVLTVLAATACVLIGWLLGFDPASIEPALLDAFVDPTVTLDPAEELQLKNLVSIIVDIVPLVQPAILTMTLVVCLHFGAAVARRSGRLERPKDDLPVVTSLPQDALILFAFALGGTFLSGAGGLVATVFAGALGTAFALVGLARFHRRTRGRPARGLALFVVYATILFLTFPIFVFVVIGLVDVWRHGERLRPTRPD
ncbi:hypothetical protein U0C82_15020 [Fulvimarina sp. 2208YS6-2-32]|uniref:DUF2232 domain-containing protein n=1 Tax=Fulvimarina uroteuthidis TaxID=3098149 RepID=A0ABU5I500_9HYPH|nr:hypothetical protein [Fulvimarina sp. 2208YS6-2-32]MDY8110452.1 hypothetical protein [Fulvimarina sp. 2208YS6-2-32]